MVVFKVENIDVDRIWRALGPWGRYQWKQLASFLFICVSWVIHQLSIVFIGFRPSFQCKPFENDTDVTNTSGIRRIYEECAIKTFQNTSYGVVVTETNCVNGWNYEIPIQQSFVTEWDFVCENAELAELTQTLLILGMMLGTFVWPALSDRFGRKPVMVFSHVILFGIVLATAFSGNYYVFIVLRILTGAVSQGALSGATLALESFPTEARSNTEVLGLFIWTTAICAMAPIAYALRNVSWRYLQITYALLSAWSIFQWWMLDESLRWVIANGNLIKAKKIIKNACKWNKKDFDMVVEEAGLTETFSDLNLSREHEDKSRDETETLRNGASTHETDKVVSNQDITTVNVKKYTIVDIVKHKHILKVSLIIWFVWITDSMVYYGLYMISSDLYGDRYINFFLSGVIEYPACFFEFVALNRIGRKLTCISFHVVGAIGLIAATTLTYTADGNTNMMTAATAFTLLGKMGITGAFSSVCVVTPELYPTNMRNTGLGVGSFMGKVGGMIAPFFRNVSSQVTWLPGAIFSVLCVIAALLFPYMPETNGIELPQTISELTEWYRVNKYSLKVGKNRLAEAEKTGESVPLKDIQS